MVLVVAFGTVVVFSLLAIRSAAGEARSDLSRAVTALSLGDTEAAVEPLQAARANVDEALSRSRQIELRVASAVPWAGIEVEVVTETVRAASEMTSAFELVASHLVSPHQPIYVRGRVDGDAAARTAEVWRQAGTLLGGARDRMEALPTPRVTEVRDAAEEVMERARQGTVAAEAITRLLEEVASSARGEEALRALFVFSNGAELRAMGGVPVFLAEFEVAHGELRMRELFPTSTSHPPTAADLADDFEAVFGSFTPSRLWSNVTLSADGPTVAETAAEMYELVSGRRPHLVVMTDLVATGYLLDGFSGVEVDGEAFDPSGLATDFLVGTYEQFETGREQNEYLMGVIEEAFEELLIQEPAGSRLLVGVRRAVEEGRVGVWASDATVQEGIALAGADLSLGEKTDRVDVAVQNFGATKLDLHTTLQTRVELETLGCAVIGRLEVDITESTPASLVETLRFSADANHWWVNAYLPPDARLRALQSNGEPSRGGGGTWGERPVASVFVPAPLGGTGTAGFEWIQPLPDSGVVTVRTNPTVSEPATEVTQEVPPAEDCEEEGR